MSTLKIEVEVTELMLKQMKAGDTVVIHTHAELPESEEPKFYSGYTEEQIRRIIEGGYLCKLGSNQSNIGKLSAFDNQFTSPFKASNGASYQYITLIREVGIRQPWFGGEYDGHLNDLVHCLFKGGTRRTSSAEPISWESVTEYTLLEVAPDD